jgi:hypothetical protein
MLNILTNDLEVTATMDLNELISQGGTAEKKLGVFVGHNLGSNTLLVKVPIHEFFEMSEVANERGLLDRSEDLNGIAQRNLDPKHAQKLAVYLLKGLAHAVAMKYKTAGMPIPLSLEKIQRKLGKQPYLAMQPITTNIRTCGFGGSGIKFRSGEEGGVVYAYLAVKDVLWVVDGQHRRFAMQMLFDFLRLITTGHKYPKRPALFPPEGEPSGEELRIWMEIFEIARTTCSVMVEVHLGLTPDQERQLFHDLNNLTKKVEASLAFQFDQSNPVNLWIKETLLEAAIIKASVVERDVTDWHDDKGYIARKDLIAVNAILFLNKSNVSGATPTDVGEKSELAIQFWQMVDEIPGFGEDGAKQSTVAAQPVVLKALAKLTYDFAYGRNRDHTVLEKLFQSINQIDFSHQNPIWRYYQMSDEERQTLVNGAGVPLSSYLPSDEGANRDIGQYNSKDGVMRFGAKHNDIFPILGDMIRWSLQLPNRHSH